MPNSEDEWDGSFTPEQEEFDRQVQENDEALFRALGIISGEGWSGV